MHLTALKVLFYLLKLQRMLPKKLLLVLFCFITSFCFSQTSDTTFKKEWIEIDTLIQKKNLPKTALEKVNALYKKAAAKKLDVQLIKCLIYKTSLEDRVFDNKPNNAISVLQNEISSTKNETAKAILYSLLANRYLQYYNNNRYRFYHRSKTDNFKKEDIETWNADDFSEAIQENFTRSIANSKLLQQATLKEYDAIILKGNARKLRPTLFDLLAHEALDYFKSGDYYLTKRSYAFELKEIEALAPAKIFLSSIFKTKDTASHLLKSLQLFKQLLQFHINDEDKNAFIDVDIERIQWVHNNLINDRKEEQYQATLEAIAKQNGARAAQANYLLAQVENNKALTYQPFGDTSQRYAYIKALQIIDAALLKYKEEDDGVYNLKILRNQILSKSIYIQTEKVNVPNQPFRALVSYKNVDTLFARIIKVEPGYEKYFTTYASDFKALAKLKTYKTFEQKLPATNDHQTHSVEIKIDALPIGEYILLTSSGNGFVDSIHKMSNQIIYVSNISYIKNENDFFVLNRETGEPLPNVKVQIYNEVWNSKKQKYETTILAEKNTDKNGWLTYKSTESNTNFEFIFSTATDKLHLRDKDYIVFSRDNNDDKGDYYKNKISLYEEDRTNVYFFTDRGIYRPGQTIYFKGIAITKDFATGKSKLIANRKNWKIYLQDVNEKSIDSVSLSTNDYGSFNATFTLPQNVLTGSFTLKTEKGETNFSVEEYKRPKYYVEFEKVKGSYRLNDSVTVTGIAKAYAGNTIDGAKVNFTIQRNARFVYDWLWRGKTMPSSESQEILNGELVTDATGKFKITFKAAADEKVNKNTDPLFTFSINADVTDINGETRSSNTTVTVGYKSLIVNAIVHPIANADSVQKINITTKNLSDENEPANVAIKIYSLQTPQRLIRKSLWQRADKFVMNKETYLTYFPTDDYADELNENNWKEGKLVYETSINTANTTQLEIPKSIIAVGYYKVEATAKDIYGNDVKDVTYMQLFNKNATAYPQYNFVVNNDVTIEPYDTANFFTASMADKIFVIQQTLTPTTKPTVEIVNRNKGLHNITFIPKENDRGNIVINEAYVINNRFYNNRYQINTPFTNKILQVNYASYRNKIEPGNKETWTVNIKGNKGEKVAAELLTSMYDASLDQFSEHYWYQPNVWETMNYQKYFESGIGFNTNTSRENYLNVREKSYVTIYDRLVKNSYQLNRVQPLWWLNPLKFAYDGLDKSGKGYFDDMNPDIRYSTSMNFASSDRLELKSLRSANVSDKGSVAIEYDKVEILKFTPPKIVKDEEVNNDGTVDKLDSKKSTQSTIQPRKNFNETAFFFPNLYADTAGNYTFSFTMQEALTQWKWQSLAHTKDLSFGSNSTTITTQKTLMVQPNAPRFMREGDNMEFVAKISNISDKELTGQATLELVDAVTGSSVDGWFQNIFPNQYFTVAAGQSAAVKFPIQIPFNFNKPLTWRVVAKAGEFSDGEENTLPVLTNRMLVTEALPLYLKTGETEKSFTFDKLLNNKSQSLSNEGITVEYTANPIWNVIQSLPYLMEYPYECAEQTFNRFYANALAASIVNKYPKIKSVFETWKNDSTAFKSNLQQNEELKQILLQETPWVLNAENEVQQQKNIALLFDMVKMSNSMNAVIEKLKQMQMESGGFAWFKGGVEDRYITNYILTGIGKLKKANALSSEINNQLESIISKALQYLDSKIKKDYNWLVTNKVDLKTNHLSSSQIQYLYMRSFYAAATNKNEAFNYYYNQAKQFWSKQNSYNAAMIGLVLNRNKESKFVATNILPSIAENATEDTAKGTVYWKDRSTCFWYASPIEHQSMMMEFLNEASPKNNIIDAAKTWLILNKQTNNWQTTVATADACYALLTTGSNWVDNQQKAQIQLGNVVINQQQKNKQDAGYSKQRIAADKVQPTMGNISVTIQTNNSINNQPSYGAVYWQYFEDLDKITEASSPLSVKKKLFIETNTSKGKVLQPISDTNQLKVGDKIIVRLELRSDRQMEYLHLKDMRASGTEPINVLSGYKWQDNLGYYEATKDASTNFFIDNLQKGVYVFEYPLYVTHTGTFSVGIATIQCMYAPQFTSHSEGIKITVKE